MCTTIPRISGVRLPGDQGLPAVMMTLLQYSSTGTLTLTGSFTGFTNSAGYYTFGNLTAAISTHSRDAARKFRDHRGHGGVLSELRVGL